MQKEYISYKESNAFSNLVLKYIEQSPDLEPFNSLFPSVENLLSLTEKRRFDDGQRKLLHKTLSNQSIKPSSKQKSNLDLLKQSKTFTICTGHQLCLFGGPLYFFLKIISCINLAERLNAQNSDYSYVPIFWMATEDHDFEEINHVHLFGKKVEWERPYGPHVGDMKLNEIVKFRTTFFDILGDSKNAQELKAVFDSCYSEEYTLAEATRKFVGHFFQNSGLLILDANDSGLKSSFKQILKKEIEEQVVYKNVQNTIGNVNGTFKIQANPSEINLFLLNEDKRVKLKAKGENVSADEDLISREEILKKIDTNSKSFSPNVLFRPVFQEFVLPNIAYVGGGGELAYWMELKSTFEAFDIDFPSLVLRNSIMIVDEGSLKKMKKFDLKIEDLFQSEEDLSKAYSTSQLGAEDYFNSEKLKTQELFASIKGKLKEVDQTLLKMGESEEQKVLNSLEKMNIKIIRAYKKKNESEIQQLKNLKAKLFPNQGLQERTENFSSFYLRYGSDFLEMLKKDLEPLDFKFSVFLP